MEKGDWVLFPQTSDDVDKANIVAKVDSVENNIVNVLLVDGSTIPVPRNNCRVVYIQVPKES